MSELVKRTAEEVQAHLDEILDLFKPGRKITVLVRSPGKPDEDFCISNDDLQAVAEMVERRRRAEQETGDKTAGGGDPFGI